MSEVKVAEADVRNVSGVGKFRYIEPPERRRTYVYPDDASVSFDRVTAVCVRPSGTHRLELENGEKVIIAGGWLAIYIEADEWSF